VGIVGTKRSYLWHQAQVCMSLARATNDPVLKERYEDLAVDFAQNAEREPDLESDKSSDPGERQE
jgi:hypothetical protein